MGEEKINLSTAETLDLDRFECADIRDSGGIGRTISEADWSFRISKIDCKIEVLIAEPQYETLVELYFAFCSFLIMDNIFCHAKF